MAVLTIPVTFDDGTEKTFIWDPGDATLDQLDQFEDLQDLLANKKRLRFRDLRPALATLLGMSDAEVGQIRKRDLDAIVAAMQGAAQEPNPTSA